MKTDRQTDGQTRLGIDASSRSIKSKLKIKKIKMDFEVFLMKSSLRLLIMLMRSME